jgi:hypothetical protein
MAATTAGDAHDAIVSGAACASEQASSSTIPFSMGVVWPAQGLAVVVPRGEIDAFTGSCASSRSVAWSASLRSANRVRQPCDRASSPNASSQTPNTAGLYCSAA